MNEYFLIPIFQVQIVNSCVIFRISRLKKVKKIFVFNLKDTEKNHNNEKLLKESTALYHHRTEEEEVITIKAKSLLDCMCVCVLVGEQKVTCTQGPRLPPRRPLNTLH